MQRVIVALIACLTLAGCGLGETAVVAAAGGASEAEQAKEALKIKARALANPLKWQAIQGCAGDFLGRMDEVRGRRRKG